MIAQSRLLLLGLLYVSSAQLPNRVPCADLGQYCRLHSDCCSNNCLTYSYRCIRSPKEQDQHQSNEVNPTTQPTLLNSIEELVDRFGGEAQGDNQNATKTGIETTDRQTNIVRENCYSNGNSCSSSDQCCTNFCAKLTNMCADAASDVKAVEDLQTTRGPFITAPSLPTYGSSMSTPTCYGIGHKCYKPEDCCSPLRCHGYLHQCVT